MNKREYVKKFGSGSLKFYCENELSLYRGQTLLSKEPETIKWISLMKPGEILWDIGANVGCYSLYAAQLGVNVLAFEPSFLNYYVLNKNIQINKMNNLIKAYCLAFDSNTNLGVLNLSTTIMGGAENTFGEEEKVIHASGKVMERKFTQGMIGIAIDKFIQYFKVQSPNHIKIDVDGNEPNIIEGAKELLKSPEVKSILIEMDYSKSEQCNSIIELLMNEGFEIVKHERSVGDISNYSGVCNFIFYRKKVK